MDQFLIFVFQFLCLLVLLTVIYNDVENQQDFKKPLNQLIIAIVVLSILIFEY